MKHLARKRFGQHFLTDRAILDAIVDAIDPKPGEAVVEIGPGLGAMTDPLVARCGRMTVIELDRDLAARLQRRSELEVIESDVLRVDFAALAGRHGQKLRVVRPGCGINNSADVTIAASAHTMSRSSVRGPRMIDRSRPWRISIACSCPNRTGIGSTVSTSTI